MIITIAGHPKEGKTTIAHKIMELLNHEGFFAYVEDDCTERVFTAFERKEKYKLASRVLIERELRIKIKTKQLQKGYNYEPKKSKSST